VGQPRNRRSTDGGAARRPVAGQAAGRASRWVDFSSSALNSRFNGPDGFWDAATVADIAVYAPGTIEAVGQVPAMSPPPTSIRRANAFSPSRWAAPEACCPPLTDLTEKERAILAALIAGRA
jgi:hypothetical protein